MARRTLEQSGKPFELLIYAPQTGEIADYECMWSLVDDTGGNVDSGKGYGVDELQALLSALLTVGESLADLPGEFTFKGMRTTLLPRLLTHSLEQVHAWHIPGDAP